jgi:Tfp pilus assembly protein PilF
MRRSKLTKIFTTFAVAIICGCASSPPDEPTLKGDLEIGLQLIEGGEFRQAIGHFQDLRRKHPKNASIEAALGQAFLGLQDFQAASSAFERSLAIADNDDIRLNYSFALTEQKRFEEARRHLKIIEEKPNYPFREKVLVNMGRTYLEERRCDLAYPILAQALLLAPTSVSANYNVGKCQMSERKWELAAKSFQAAVDECQGCIDPYLELIRALYLNGQKAAAKKKLDSLFMNKLDSATDIRARKLQQEINRLEKRGR